MNHYQLNITKTDPYQPTPTINLRCQRQGQAERILGASALHVMINRHWLISANIGNENMKVSNGWKRLSSINIIIQYLGQGAQFSSRKNLLNAWMMVGHGLLHSWPVGWPLKIAKLTLVDRDFRKVRGCAMSRNQCCQAAFLQSVPLPFRRSRMPGLSDSAMFKMTSMVTAAKLGNTQVLKVSPENGITLLTLYKNDVYNIYWGISILILQLSPGTLPELSISETREFRSQFFGSIAP